MHLAEERPRDGRSSASVGRRTRRGAGDLVGTCDDVAGEEDPVGVPREDEVAQPVLVHASAEADQAADRVQGEAEAPLGSGMAELRPEQDEEEQLPSVDG